MPDDIQPTTDPKPADEQLPKSDDAAQGVNDVPAEQPAAEPAAQPSQGADSLAELATDPAAPAPAAEPAADASQQDPTQASATSETMSPAAPIPADDAATSSDSAPSDAPAAPSDAAPQGSADGQAVAAEGDPADKDAAQAGPQVFSPVAPALEEGQQGAVTSTPVPASEPAPINPATGELMADNEDSAFSDLLPSSDDKEKEDAGDDEPKGLAFQSFPAPAKNPNPIHPTTGQPLRELEESVFSTILGDRDGDEDDDGASGDISSDDGVSDDLGSDLSGESDGDFGSSFEARLRQIQSLLSDARQLAGELLSEELQS